MIIQIRLIWSPWLCGALGSGPNGSLIKIELVLAQEYFYICGQKDSQDIPGLEIFCIKKIYIYLEVDILKIQKSWFSNEFENCRNIYTLLPNTKHFIQYFYKLYFTKENYILIVPCIWKENNWSRYLILSSIICCFSVVF